MMSAGLCVSMARGDISTTGDVSPADPATWTISTYAYIGETAEGGVTVADSDLISGNSYLGFQSSSTGVATVTTPAATWTNSNDLYVGYNGDGTLNIADGGSVTVIGDTYVAAQAGSVGAISFNNNGALTTGGLLGAAADLNGVGTINTNGLVSDVDLVFGAGAGLTQTLTLDGPGQDITVELVVDGSAPMGAGYSRTGSMRISDGLTVESTRGAIGLQSGSAGLVTVSGGGSAWANSSELSVGDSGEGTLQITSGGVVSNTYGSIGLQSGSAGAVTVSGGGSAWANSSDLSVGDSGEGTLEIDNGAVVGNYYGVIGLQSGSAGDVTVSGTGSTWANEGDLYVGLHGAGALNIADGGLVSVGAALTIDNNNNGDSFITMGSGGMLGLYGDAHGLLGEFLGLIDGSDDIRCWDESVWGWVDITEATAGADYTLNYLDSGDLNGYTVLTVTTPTPTPGDTNRDYIVDSADYENLMAQFGGPPGAESADLNGDGMVDLEDFAIMRTRLGSGVASAPDARFGVTTPEPATLILAAAGLPLLLKRRRNRC